MALRSRLAVGGRAAKAASAAHGSASPFLPALSHQAHHNHHRSLRRRLGAGRELSGAAVRWRQVPPPPRRHRHQVSTSAAAATEAAGGSSSSGAAATVKKGKGLFSAVLTLFKRVWGSSWRIVNILLVCSIIGTALWNALTISPLFWERWDALLSSRPFVRFISILKAIPADNWAAYERAVAYFPWATAMAITGITYLLADWTAQTYEGKGMFGFNVWRVLRTGLSGFFVLGPLAHAYYDIQDHVMPSGKWYWSLAKVAVDQSLYASTYNVCFFVALGLLSLNSPKEVWNNVRSKFWPVLRAGWRLWPFLHIITYTVIPTQHKLLWVNSCELVWVTFLSLIANERRRETKEVVSQLQDQQESDPKAQRAIQALGDLSEINLVPSVAEDLKSDRAIKVFQGQGRLKEQTVIEISLPDRPGLLLDIFGSVSALNLNVLRAFVDTTNATLAEVRASEDQAETGTAAIVFYTIDAKTGLPLDAERMQEVQVELAEKLEVELVLPEEVPSLVAASAEATDAAVVDAVAIVEEEVKTDGVHAPDDEVAMAAAATTTTPAPVDESEAQEEEAPSEKMEFFDPATDLLFAIELETETQKELSEVLKAQGLSTQNLREKSEEEEFEEEFEEADTVGEETQGVPVDAEVAAAGAGAEQVEEVEPASEPTVAGRIKELLSSSSSSSEQEIETQSAAAAAAQESDGSVDATQSSEIGAGGAEAAEATAGIAETAVDGEAADEEAEESGSESESDSESRVTKAAVQENLQGLLLEAEEDASAAASAAAAAATSPADNQSSS